MKTISLLIAFGCAFVVRGASSTSAVSAPESRRVGVYDSRLVAYAYFWSEPAQKERKELAAQAKIAQAGSNAEQHEALVRQLAANQKRIHLQVFGSAPAQEAMAALGDRLPALCHELAVGSLVSKWDAAALHDVPEADRRDVTERLVTEFLTPTPKQRKVLDQMKTTKPLPKWKVKLLQLFGSD